MGKPHRATLDDLRLKRSREHTSGSKTFQYREEKRPIGIPLVAASETGKAQTQPQYRSASLFNYSWRFDIGNGGYKATALATGRVKKCRDRGICWEAEP